MTKQSFRPCTFNSCVANGDRRSCRDTSRSREAAAAGDLYWVLGSFSGTAPEQPVGLLGLPLVFDPYFVLTATTPNTGPLGSTLRVLGASGDAQATLTLPPGSPAILGGSTVHHAFGVFDAGSLMVEFISNPVPTRLLP